MRHAALPLLLVSFLGCGPSYRDVYYSNAKPTPTPEDRIYQTAMAAMVDPACRPGQEPSPPAVHVVTWKTVPVDQPCGLVSDEVLTRASLAEFVSKLCGGQASDDCSKRFTAMFVARLGERYTLADWQLVSTKCTAHPIECQTWRNVELWALASHNAAVIAWMNASVAQVRAQENAQLAQEAQIEFERRQAEAQRRRDLIRAAADALGAMSRPAIHCTSTTFGSTTQTSCQ